MPQRQGLIACDLGGCGQEELSQECVYFWLASSQAAKKRRLEGHTKHMLPTGLLGLGVEITGNIYVIDVRSLSDRFWPFSMFDYIGFLSKQLMVSSN